jgi:hypothetical protein
MDAVGMSRDPALNTCSNAPEHSAPSDCELAPRPITAHAGSAPFDRRFGTSGQFLTAVMEGNDGGRMGRQHGGAVA